MGVGVIKVIVRSQKTEFVSQKWGLVSKNEVSYRKCKGCVIKLEIVIIEVEVRATKVVLVRVIKVGFSSVTFGMWHCSLNSFSKLLGGFSSNSKHEALSVNGI